MWIRRRMLLKIFLSMGKNPFKKCSYRKVIFVSIATMITWSVLILIIASEFRSNLSPEITNDSLVTFGEHGMEQTSLDSNEWSQVGQVYLYDNLIQENPLGTYFSDRLAGILPVGTSHLEFFSAERQRSLKMVLIFVRNITDPSVGVFGEFFARQRIEYRFRTIYKELPPLVVKDIGIPKYSLIVFDDYVTYLNMDPTHRELLDSYCKNYSIGVLAIAQSMDNKDIEIFSHKKLKFRHHLKMNKYKLNQESDIWRVAKVDKIYLDELPSSDWTIFITNHETYKPLVFSSIADDVRGLKSDVNHTEFGCVIVVHDQGLLDGIQRIILGYSLTFWLNSIVATDAITYLTGGLFGLPLTRLLQVDIDDMFVGDTGIRTLVKDAEAMVASQEKIRKHVPEFTYNLGFSGEYYMKGNDAEQAGDQRIVELARHFLWFDHLHRHDRLLNLNRTRLAQSMSTNAQFAQEYHLPLSRDYMVPPFHAGVYPVYETLYDEWNNRGVIYTSTMEYPKQSPVWGRRGFIYRGVMVLPRLDCNLYTTVNKFEDFMGGKSGLDRSINGGRLFKLFLHTPVLIFMTHMSNYANDQLGQYSFENVVEFVTKWTNLKLMASPPKEIARIYFEMYPHESTPIWTNPCEYNTKHLEILPPDVICSKFPKFFIIGPPKSGTAMLQIYLEAHPMMVSTKDDNEDSVDSHFFSGSTYHKGLAWYQMQFPERASEDMLLFETSNIYFHDEESPMRIYAMVPQAKIVVVLPEPMTGAYSCYQDMMLRQGSGVTNYTFLEAIRAEDEDTSLKFPGNIRRECLKPRLYAAHLARWLQFFPRDQIFLVDEDQLHQDPITVLNQLQRFFNLKPYTDFTSKLRYNSKNNCFYQANGECLSFVNDRTHPTIDNESRRFMQVYFTDHNINLKILLTDIDQQYPQWLADTSPDR